MDTLHALFEKVAAENAARTALVFSGQEYSYSEVFARARKICASLQNLEIGKGDRVALLLENSPDFVAATYGIFLAGAVMVPLNTFLKAGEIRHILNDCEVRVMISSGAFFDVHQSLRMKVPSLQGIYLVEHEFSEVGQSLKSRPPVMTEGTDLAVILYTSGTTGHPKGAMLTHRNLLANVRAARQALAFENTDRVVCALPLFHSFMLMVCVFVPLSHGAGTLILKSLTHSGKQIFGEIQKARATVLPGIPPLFQAMVQGKFPFYFNWVCPLRVAISGAAPLPAEVRSAFRKKFRFPLIEGYGLSEASPLVSLNRPGAEGVDGSVGQAIAGVTVSIRNEEGGELPVGEVGEIWVSGENVMQGYFNNPDATADTLREGWLLTGDMGRVDAAGFLTIVDRKKDMVLVRGMNVYPREIEEVMLQYPGIREAAVVGRDDQRRGELPHAFYTVVEGREIDEKDLFRHLREHLADYKLPRSFKKMEMFPKTPTGKVIKRELV
ncbi:MAG: long-chain fatty acid--CoA ligase [Verrucomicrobiae bacterium]|nr:long-chain fatty acid--CoA ligase [Verrucomicrobiae bacterium]